MAYPGHEWHGLSFVSPFTGLDRHKSCAACTNNRPASPIYRAFPVQPVPFMAGMGDVIEGQGQIESLTSAIRAIGHVVAQARFLAYRNEDAAKVAGLLDETDYLLGLLTYDSADAEEFRRVLEHVGAKYPELGYLAEEFDRENERVIMQIGESREAA